MNKLKKTNFIVKAQAFTLIEVMVAIGLIGISLLVFNQAQIRSIKMAAKIKKMTVATLLAKKQLLHCKHEMLKGGSFSIGDFKESGDFFGDGYDDFSWECFGYGYNLPVPSSESLIKAMQKYGKKANMPQIPQQEMAALSPMLQSFSEILRQSIRELVVIISFNIGGVRDHVKVVTHVVDKTPLRKLSATIPEVAPKK